MRQLHLLFVLLVGICTVPAAAYDCCAGRMCNENWDSFDSATGNCCMLPNGGKMQEQTDVGSCSCPSLQQCDMGPKAEDHAPPINKEGRTAPADPERPFEYVMVGCTIVLVTMMTIIFCASMWKVGSGYEKINEALEKLPLQQGAARSLPYSAGGGYVGPPAAHQMLSLAEEAKRRQQQQHLNNPHHLPATYYSGYQNRDMLDMLRYVAEYQEQQRQNSISGQSTIIGQSTTSGQREEEAGRKLSDEAAVADTPAPGTVTS